MVGLIMPSKDMHILKPGNCKVYLIGIKGVIKDLEIGRLYYIIWMGPKCPYKMEVDTREGEDNPIVEEGLDVATNQGLPAAVIKSWKRQVPNSPLQPLANAASILTSAQ